MKILLKSRISHSITVFVEWVSKLPCPLRLIFYFFMTPTVLNTAINLFYFTCNPYNGSRSFGGILFSYLFSYLLYSFLLGIFRRVRLASLTLSILYFILGYVNQMKMFISGMNPIFLSDLFFVSDAQSLSDMIFYSDLGGAILDYLPQTLLFLFLTLIPVIIDFILDYRIKTQKNRFITLISSFLVLLLIFIPIKPLHAFGSKLFFGKTAGYDPIVYYNQKGFLSGVVAQYWNSHPIVTVDDSEVERLLANAPADSDGTWGSPNIIMVFSESFFDLSKLEDVAFSTPPTENFNRLKHEGISFSMLSPTIGGLSCNSEYQFLTGGNLSFYPMGTVPYTMMYGDNNDAQYRYPSVIEEFRNNGYTTEIVSTWQKDLCNCDTVYESMGLDRYRYEYGDEIKGLYYSDASTSRAIKSTFDQKAPDEKLFYFTQTSQAHMPFFYDKYDAYDITVISSPLNEKENGILTSYAQGIYDADVMLGDIYAYIQTLDEPTLLVFFGDHLPALRDCSIDLFSKLSYFNTDDPLLNEARRYTTEGLILANFPLEDDVNYIGQDLLIPYIFSQTELDVSPYYRYLNATRESISALGVFGAYGNDGSLYPVDSLPDDMKRVFEERKQVQYYLFR